MKLSASEQQSIVALLTRIYHDICAMETEFNLLVGEGDFRPRIEYFHDAVRAFTGGTPDDGRLSVELLAYDLSCLRYIQSMPLAPFKPHGAMLSAHTDIVEVAPALTVKTKRPDRVAKERISELYQHYTVLFAGLLKPYADSDCRGRTDHLNQDIMDINALIQLLGQSADAGQIAAQAQHLEDEDLRTALLAFLRAGKQTQKDEVKKLVSALKGKIGKKDKEIATIEAAHMNYALAQLAVYEASKDLIKKMAVQGMNLVGKFVEASLAQAKRDLGR